MKTKRKKAKLKFRFEASEAGSSFECKLDKGSYEPCSSPHKVKVKAKRKAKTHTIKVRAVDAAGNTDFSPEKWKGKVKRKR